MAKKKNRHIDERSTTNTKSDTFGMIYETLLRSDAFISMSQSAKSFYAVCRVQAQRKASKDVLYNHGKEFERSYSEHCFVFPAKHLLEFGIGKNHSTRYFDELISHGFIKKLEKNNQCQKVNVYEFVDDWKRYKI